MSRVGKKPIEIPDGVEVKLEGQKAVVKGPKGELSLQVRPEIKISLEGKKITVKPEKETKDVRALWGLTRALIFNLIKGVTEGFEKKLEIEGVGYRASLEGQDLILQMGFSHPVKIESPEGIKFSVEKNVITVSGIDKELVGGISAKIRKVRPPEPYKGKGIRYEGEKVRRKLGKKAVAAAT
jgi:large subunit ribosomal protein L6